jgi:hypothetical protein
MLVGKPERNHKKDHDRWANNIKIYAREMGWDGMDWIDQA